MKHLPIGMQTFSDLILGNFVYVDKTAIIFELIKKKSVYFFARPRRFGKSLLLSTMQAIFEGKRELFKGLAIDKLDHDWKVRPVIRIDFSSVNRLSPKSFKESLINYLIREAGRLGVSIDRQDQPSDMLTTLVQKMYAVHGPVVLLVDEYDKPLLDHLKDPTVAEHMRLELRSFYDVFKPLDEYLYFLFITGVSKFTQTSIFSGLNNLHDISFFEKTATLCGYTKSELQANFVLHLEVLANKMHTTTDIVLEELERWYDGYSFEWGCEKMFNPFSVLNTLSSGKFENYWMMTGTPNFLATMFKGQAPVPQIDRALRVSAPDLVIVDLERLSFIPILVQTGYLTIVGQDQDGYLLDFPNQEVSRSYALWSLAGSFNKESTDIRSLGIMMRAALREKNIDDFFELVIPMFAAIPHDIQVDDREKYYQSMIYLLCLLVGIDMGVELSTNIGIIDAVIKTDECVFIFEFKLRGSAQEALDQIKTKKYSERFLNDGKKIVLVGVQFSLEQRNIVGWLVEAL